MQHLQSIPCSPGFDHQIHVPSGSARQHMVASPHDSSWRPRRSTGYLSSASRPVEASTLGLTFTSEPLNTQPRWLGEKRGASDPSLISRVTAKRLNAVGGRYNRVLLGNPSVAVSISPTFAVIMP